MDPGAKPLYPGQHWILHDRNVHGMQSLCFTLLWLACGTVEKLGSIKTLPLRLFKAFVTKPVAKRAHEVRSSRFRTSFLSKKKSWCSWLYSLLECNTLPQNLVT